MSSTTTINPKYRNTIGHIEGLANIRPISLQEAKVWCLDNSVYGGKFTLDRWRLRLDSLISYVDTCLFVVIPDVVGDAQKTIKQFFRYKSYAQGWPLAFVSQDNIKQHANDIPWDEFQCLFVGGTDGHKLGKEAGWIINEAHSRGKWVHVGRVNSTERLLKFWNADSWDGTTLSYAPSGVRKIHQTVLQVRAMKGQRQLL